MDRNYFATRDQVLFITYEDMIKMNYAILLQTVVKDYQDDLGEILKIDELVDYDIDNLNRLCVERSNRNPLTYLAKDESYSDLCEELLDTFEKEFTDMYAKADFTDFGAKLYNILMQSFVKKVYIHTDKKIYQIPYDCRIQFKDFDDKIEYVYGDMVGLIKSMTDKPTTYIVNDIEKVKMLYDEKLLDYTEVLLGELGYNFKINENKDDIVLKHDLDSPSKMKEGNYKLGFISIINLKENHFSCLEGFNESKEPDKTGNDV